MRLGSLCLSEYCFRSIPPPNMISAHLLPGASIVNQTKDKGASLLERNWYHPCKLIGNDYNTTGSRQPLPGSEGTAEESTLKHSFTFILSLKAMGSASGVKVIDTVRSTTGRELKKTAKKPMRSAQSQPHSTSPTCGDALSPQDVLAPRGGDVGGEALFSWGNKFQSCG